MDRLKEVRLDASIGKDIADRVAALSRHIDAHSHSDQFAGQKPTPETLLLELQLFEQIQKRHKQLQADQGAVSAKETSIDAPRAKDSVLVKDKPPVPDVAKIESENRLTNHLRTRN